MFCFFYFRKNFIVAQQKTLKSNLFFQGLGVHTGALSSIKIMPTNVDSGIRFINVQNPSQVISVGAVIPESAPHATVVRFESWALSTIEHLMAALMLMEIDNVDIFVHGTEIPILDGSSLPFVQGIMDVGVVLQDAPRRWITPKNRLEFSDDKGRFIHIEPSNNDRNKYEPILFVDYNADFVHPLNGDQTLQGAVTKDFFMKEIAPARTFGFLEQLPLLRHHNLAQGTSLGNTVVIGHDELLNDMRLPNECVRHKFLDLIGDLSLLGRSLIGSIKANKTSHNFNRLVIEHYIKNPEQWLISE